jgi:hypothetical protein
MGSPPIKAIGLSGSRVALSLAGMTMSESIMIFRWLIGINCHAERAGKRQFSELPQAHSPYSLTPRRKSYR